MAVPDGIPAGFVGPDRRAKGRPWRGEDRRALTPKKIKVALNRDRGAASESLGSDAAGAGLAIGVDLRLDLGEPAQGVVLESIEKRQAAGTRPRMIHADISRARETFSGPGGHGGRKRCAGAWTSEAEIGLARHQERNKSNPEYGPENHRYAVSFNDAASMTARLCPLLKAFAKFETNSPGIAAFSRVKTMRNVRFCSLSIQKRGEIELFLLKIIRDCGTDA